MNLLKETVRQLNKEEARLFKIHASRFNEHESRKDIQLFDLYRKAGNPDEDEICRKIYGPDGKNAFYRLKNRVLEEVNKTLVMNQVRELSPNLTMHFLSLYHYYIGKQHYPLAENYLKKAEKQAAASEQYELLDLIFGEYIRLSREIFTINPEHFIRARKENFEKLSNIRQMDEIIAVLSHRLKITQNLDPRNNPVLEIYGNIIREFSNDIRSTRLPQFRIRIFKVVSQLLVQKRDYTNLRQFLLQSFSEFESDRIFNKQTHDTKVEMLIYVVNTLNELKEYEKALEYSETLKNALGEYNQLLQSKYIYFYYQGLVASYQRTDAGKAIDTLQHMLKSKEVSANPYYEIFTYSNLAFLHFNKGDYQLATKNINKIYLNDFYANTDISLKIKIGIVELVARYEMNDPEILEYRLDQLRRDFASVDKTYHSRELQLFDILDLMVKSKDVPSDRPLKKLVQKFFGYRNVNDTELIDYDEWLKRKLKLP